MKKFFEKVLEVIGLPLYSLVILVLSLVFGTDRVTKSMGLFHSISPTGFIDHRVDYKPVVEDNFMTALKNASEVDVRILGEILQSVNKSYAVSFFKVVHSDNYPWLSSITDVEDKVVESAVREFTLHFTTQLNTKTLVDRMVEY